MLFADDTNFFIRSSSIIPAINALNTTFCSMKKWLTNYNLILNSEKTKNIFHDVQSDVEPPRSINTIIIEICVVDDSTKVLGIILDTQLIG